MTPPLPSACQSLPRRTLVCGLSALLLACLVALGGCYMPRPAGRVLLQVSANGSYVLAGKPVAAADLQAALQAEQATAPTSLIEIQVSPQAGAGAFQQAVRTARAVHARIAFAEDALPN